MSAPVFVVEPAALASAQPGSVVTVDGSEGRHAVTVTRLRAGEAIHVVDGHGTRVIGTVRGHDARSSCEVDVESVEHEVEPRLRLVVVQALAKGERGELAVEQLTEIGVDVIVPWSAAHCVVQWKQDRIEKSRQRWMDAAHAAAKQSRRARFPIVAGLADTAAVVARVREARGAVLLHESAAQGIAGVSLPESGDLVIVVGPEGGISDDELVTLQAAGATCVRLGPSVLRTSSAGMAAVAALMASSPRWAVGNSGADDRREPRRGRMPS